MKRPTLITILCVSGFIGTVFTPFALLSDTPISMTSGMTQSEPFPTWFIVFSLIIAVGYLVALIDIWKMHKRGIEVYTILAICEYIVGFVTGTATITGLVIAIITTGLIWIYYKKMIPPSLFSKPGIAAQATNAK